MCNIFARFAQDCTYFPMCNICARFAQDCTSFSNVQYMRKICARLYFFLQCAIYSQDLCKIVLYLFPPMRSVYVQNLCKIVLLSPMRKICTRLYLFPQCAIYVQDLHKIVLLSPMCNICARFAQDLHKIVLISQCVILRNICARFVQDCTSLSNVQYMHKIAGIIGKKYATYHISAPNLE